MDENLAGYLIPSALSFVCGYLLRYVEPSPRLVHWFPGTLVFQVPFQAPNGTQQVGTVFTATLNIQNTGWRPATQIQVIHAQRPQFFQLQPPVGFTESTTPTGEHVVNIPSLGRRDFVTIQILSTGASRSSELFVRLKDNPGW